MQLLNTIRTIWSHPIAKHNRLAAFGRFVRWQLASRLIREPVIMPFVVDSKLVMERGMTGATGNFYCGLHEFTDMAFVLHFLQPNDLFIDIGANIGSYTVLASKVAKARSISFEPVPSTFSRLVRNIVVNNVEALVHAHNLAVGASTGTVRFSMDRDTMNQVVKAGYSGQAADVKIITLDEALQNESPAMLKIDVEGHEEGVLAGATETLKKRCLKAVLTELDSPVLQGVMISNGFVRSEYKPQDRSLTQAASRARTSSNSLWVRDTDSVIQRCKTGKEFSVYGERI